MFKMVPTIFKNLIAEKATRRYPYETREPYAQSRGQLLNDVQLCNFCGVCAAKCPCQCITVNKPRATWQCELGACLFCGICVAACPKKSLTQLVTYAKPMSEKQTVCLQGTIKEKVRPDITSAEQG